LTDLVLPLLPGAINMQIKQKILILFLMSLRILYVTDLVLGGPKSV
jgi:uncharacterized membrane protein